MAGHCGSCTACCRVFAIPEFKKPAGKWCTHCAIGVGCKVYAERPMMCIEYQCMWLQSQERIANPASRLGPELRPDRCKVVFSPTTNPNIIAAITMPGMENAYRSGAAAALIKRLVADGVMVAVGPPAARQQTLVSKAGERTVSMTEPDANGMQWSIKS